MSSGRLKTHPKDLPYMVVAESDEGDPPRIALFGTEIAATNYATERAYHDRVTYLVFRVEAIVSAQPQAARVTRLAQGKPGEPR